MISKVWRTRLTLVCTVLLVWKLTIGFGAVTTAWWSLALEGGCWKDNHCTDCNNISNLTASQREMCQRDPRRACLRALSRGAREAIVSCQTEFSDSKWNCSTFYGRYPFGSFVTNCTRESAVLTAFTTAGAVKGVAEACHDQLITNCPCVVPRPAITVTADETVINVCDENVKWAIEKVDDFIADGEPMTEKDCVDEHNTQVGAKLMNNLTKDCVCHGTSGSCSVKTCYRKTPSLEEVGARLKNLYTSYSVQVKKNSEGELVPVHGNTPITNDNLVYLSDSPDFCTTDLQRGIPGTAGRLCNPNPGHPDSCETLCCGKGAIPTVITVTEEVCEFVWCCYIECRDGATKNVTEHRCR